MNQSLSKSANRVQEALNDLGCHTAVIEFQEHTRTAQEAADRVGCSLGQIVKSLIFKGSESGKPFLVLTSGANRVDEKKLGTHIQEHPLRADPEFVRAVTGFAIGGVPPLALVQPLKIFIDEDLIQYKTVWAAGGTPNAVFEISPELLRQVTGGEVIQVK